MANNETLIPIPGRLHSVATEGHVTGTDEIIDDTLQKDQATINQEVQQSLGTGGSVDSRIAAAVNVEKERAQTEESTLNGNITTEQTRAEAAEGALDTRVGTLEVAVGTSGSVDSRIASAVATETSRAQEAEADRYTKSETYTKEEVNNLITTPNQEYVSVTATNETTSVTDILPATGATDTIYQVGNWDGTQHNDSVFSEYAWNGSTYIKLSTKSQVGEVYDISANHADTKYADLAAALGTNGANVPVGVRRGGMSVKFVQSSDNKYVQYRLMSNSFTTTATEWQGIDEELQDVSINLATSEAIYNSIEVNNARHNQNLLTIAGKFWYKDGDKIIINSYSDLKRVERIVVKEGSEWKIKCRGYVEAESYYIADKNMNYITSSGSNSVFTGTITIPSGGYYLLLNTYGSLIPEAVEGNSLTDIIQIQGNNIDKNSLDIIDFFETYNRNKDGLYEVIRKFIKDIELSADDEDYLYDVSLLAILNGAVIGGNTYYSINISFKPSQGTTVNKIFDISNNRNGIQYYNVSLSGFAMKVVVDWDALLETQYEFGADFKFKGDYCKQHLGAIYDWERFNLINAFIVPKYTDQMFIYNGEVVCFNNYRNASNNVYARYAKVNLGAKCEKVMCKFKLIGISDAVLCVATMSGDTDNPIADITRSSFHVTVERTSFNFGLYVNHVWNATSVNLSSPLNTDTEYEFGYEFLGNDEVKFYLPDGTTDIRTISGVDAVNGKYVIFEQYGTNTSSEITMDFPRVTICSIYAKPISGITLHDNFLRANGPLTVAPTGHIYRTFRNKTDDDTIYDI